MSNARIGRPVGALLALGMCLLCVGACAGPKYVTHVASRDNKVKFAYHQRTSDGPQTGIIQCDVGAQGELEQCKEMPINFKD